MVSRRRIHARAMFSLNAVVKRVGSRPNCGKAEAGSIKRSLKMRSSLKGAIGSRSCAATNKISDDVSGSRGRALSAALDGRDPGRHAGNAARRDGGVKQIGRSRMPSPDFAAFLLPLTARGCGEATRPKDLPCSHVAFSARLGHDLRECWRNRSSTHFRE